MSQRLRRREGFRALSTNSSRHEFESKNSNPKIQIRSFQINLDMLRRGVTQKILTTCNAKTSSRIRLCIARSSHFCRANFMPQLRIDVRLIVAQIPTMSPDLFETEKESNMIKKLLGAAAMAAMIYPTVPASAANVAGCSGGNLEKTESAVEVMADGPGKIVAQKEIAQAQDALLGGKMGACAMHLTRAMHAGSMTQAPYAGTMAQGPGETTSEAPYQPQQNWTPVKPAL
jgi:hypothetical protein